MAPATSSTANIPLSATESALVSAPETVSETAQTLASESVAEAASIPVPVAAPLAASELENETDLTPVITQQVTEVSEAPILTMDVLEGAGADLSLSELGLGSYTPVGLIQNLLEFMHVSIGLPWWGAIVAGQFFFFMN